MSNRGNFRLGAVLVILLLAVIAIWLFAGGDDDDGDGGNSGADPIAASIASEDEVRDLATEQGTPIYWAGPQDGAELELSAPEEGRTYVRYLTDGATAGDPRPEFLTVGTYSFAEPIPALEELASEAGGVQRTAPGGGIVYFNRDRPQSVYLAYPGIDVQIEVYDPDAERAKNLVTSGQIVPVN